MLNRPPLAEPWENWQHLAALGRFDNRRRVREFEAVEVHPDYAATYAASQLRGRWSAPQRRAA